MKLVIKVQCFYELINTNLLQFVKQVRHLTVKIWVNMGRLLIKDILKSCTNSQVRVEEHI